MDKEDISTHIQWNIIQSLKEWNNAIYSNMDALKDYHTEWSKSDREEELSCDIPYMWDLNRNDTNELRNKTETHSQT